MADDRTCDTVAGGADDETILSRPNPSRIDHSGRQLFDLNRWLAREQRQLVLARGRSTFRAVRIPIPANDPGAMALVEQVRQNLGDRWIGEVSIQDHQAALGLSTPW